jgi:tRNA U34 2-thiouridine synthase MnmA/TrmU
MARLNKPIAEESIESIITRSVDLLRSHATQWPSPSSASVSSFSSSMRAHLLSSVDPWKDQTYFLALTRAGALSNAIFPIGHLHKSQVRAIAAYAGLPNATKAESMGICFVGKRRFPEFISEYITQVSGNFVSLIPLTFKELNSVIAGAKLISPTAYPSKTQLKAKSKFDRVSTTILPCVGETPEEHKNLPGTLNKDGLVIMGRHRGLACYTMGQQASMSGMTSRWYVASKNAATNEVMVVPDRYHPAMFFDRLYVREMNWITGQPPHQDLLTVDGTYRCLYRTRHHAPLRGCTLKRLAAPANMNETARHSGQPSDMDTTAEWEVIYDTPHTGTALAQSVVLYSPRYTYNTYDA